MSASIPLCRPAIGDAEIEAVAEVLRSGWITTGAQCYALEDAFCETLGCRHAIAVSSATAGLHILLTALDIKAGDEVITPSQTWVSTVNLIVLAGATPVFVDVDRDTLMVSPEAIRDAITPRTKAIIPVHYAGAPVDLDPIRQLAQQHDIALIEDAAHAVGTRYKGVRIGATGTAIFSLHAIKNVTSAEGGVIVTDDDALADQLKMLKFHGLGVDAFDRQTNGRRPQAEVLSPGYKCNLADMNAAIALTQWPRLDEINARRGELCARYREGIRHLPLIPLDSPSWEHLHAHHLCIVRVDDRRTPLTRDAIMQGLKDDDIGSGIHFKAVHLQKYYRERFPADTLPHALPNTEWNNDRLFSLPLFPDLSFQDVDRVTASLTRILED